MDINILKAIMQRAIDNSDMSNYPRLPHQKPAFLTNELKKPMGKYRGFNIKEINGEYFIFFDLSNYAKPAKRKLLDIMKHGVFFTAFWGVENFREIPKKFNALEDDGSLEYLYKYFSEALKEK